jgi:protocatechuate 3,4-dioxygenase alpha subunit
MTTEAGRLKQTPSQTVGPYFAYGLTPEQYGYPFRALVGATLALEDTPGEHIRLVGRILDGEGAPIPDAMVEIWQADGEGRYAHPADRRGANAPFAGFGRSGTGTDREHRFVFETIKPGAPGAGQAPHLNVILFMRGLLSHLYTRIYFADEAEANAADPVLTSVEASRRQTLIAARETTPAGIVYRLDLHMQGPDETVFFDV